MDNQIRTLLMTAFGQASSFALLDANVTHRDLQDQIVAARDTGVLLRNTLLELRTRLIELDNKKDE